MNQLFQLIHPTKREQELGAFRTWSWPFGAFPNGERNKRNAYQALFITPLQPSPSRQLGYSRLHSLILT